MAHRGVSTYVSWSTSNLCWNVWADRNMWSTQSAMLWGGAQDVDLMLFSCWATVAQHENNIKSTSCHQILRWMFSRTRSCRAWMVSDSTHVNVPHRCKKWGEKKTGVSYSSFATRNSSITHGPAMLANKLVSGESRQPGKQLHGYTEAEHAS